MTYRSIFVHLDDSPQVDARLAAAARVATAYPAELTGAYIVPGGYLTPFASAILPGELRERRAAELAAAEEAAGKRFAAAVKQAGIQRSVFHAPAGDAMAAAVLHARYADLAIVGQPAPDQPDAAFATELANAVLMGSGRPVLFVPYTGMTATIGERILIAWKDSRESARAVADALPFLKDAKKVLAVAVTATGDESVRDVLADKAVEGFLARHEVHATVKRTVAPDMDSGELLLSHAADIGADLIVMGGYSRPRFAQLVWGGVTRLLLSSMTVPVLMSH
jgi:nucleotide-binding universal stress UspA family protein